MKLYFLAVFSLVACTTNIDSVNGTIKVKNSDIISKKMIVDSRQPTLVTETNNSSCFYAGYCMGCGMQIDGKVGCGFAFYYSCHGTRYEKIGHTRSVIHYEYETKNGIIRSVQYSTEDVQVIESGPCS